jgi:hypothetical protein
VTEGLAAKARVQWNIATGAVACMHEAWLQRERLVDEVISKDSGQWAPAMGADCKSMLKRSTCCEMQAAVLQID